MRESFYTIGQLAAISDLSIQTLRYYDKINLFKPSEVDNSSRYRYYSDSDILTLRIIRDMKEIGFSLDDIKEYLQNDNSSFDIHLLEKKRQEYKEKLMTVNDTLNRINDRINKLRLRDTAANSLSEFSKTIEIKRLPKRTIAFTRYYSSCSHEILAKRYFELDNLLKDNNITALHSRLAIYHDFLEKFEPEDSDLEICIPVNAQYADHNFVRILDEGFYATGIYKGEYQGQCSYLATWVRKQGYEITGPGVEVYINSFMNTRFPKNYVTEVQFPVKKILTL